MKTRGRQSGLSGGAAFVTAFAIGAVFASAPAHASIRGKVSLINGGQQNPPVDSGGQGCARYRIDTTTNTLDYHISYCGLDGVVTVAHFHRGAIGTNGPVVHSLTTVNPIVGTWTYLESDEPAILSGEIYVNIHSTLHPGGEIRGQVVDMVALVNGAQENPPVVSSGEGYGLFNLNTVANELEFHISYMDLEGTEMAAHIHGFALYGTNAPVLFPLPAGSPKVGTWVYDGALEDFIVNGATYVNIHSTDAPGGEIRGQIVRYVEPLDSGQAVPPNNSEGCGCGLVAINKKQTQLGYYVEYDELTGPATAAHIHGFAPAGATAGVLHGIGTANPSIGLWTYGAADEPDVIAGLTYFNVHTAAAPAGEIRGQILFADKPCAGDIDCDGNIGFGDLVDILANWGPYGPCPPYVIQDLDQDCAIGFSDLLFVLANWGPC